MKHTNHAWKAGIAMLALLLPASAWAAGFGVSEFGSLASGRAYSGSAAKDSAAMVYWNPAQLTQMDGLDMSLGIAGIHLGYKYASLDDEPMTAESEKTLTTPPSFYMSYKLGGKNWGNWSLGAGVGVPFGSSVEWPSDWFGNQSIRQLGLRVFEIRAVTAFQLNDKIAVGGGVRVMPATVELSRAVGLGSTGSGDVELAGDAVGLGWTAGVSLFMHPQFTVALTFKSTATLDFEGAADFTLPPPFDPALNDSDVRAQLKLPWAFSMGVAWEAIEDRLIFTGDLTGESWSAFRRLRIKFLDDAGNVATETTDPRDSRDILGLKAGVEYRFGEVAAVRAGYLFDPYIAPENRLGPAPPDSNTHAASLGASYYWNWLGVHGHFLYAFMAPRTGTTSTFPGKYEGGFPGGAKAMIWGVSLSAKLDAEPALGCGCDKHEADTKAAD